MPFASLCLVSVAGATTHPQAPPTSPPAHWGPVSINLEDVPYPHPVSFVELTLFVEPVRMAFMDVVPAGSPRGQTVVLLHGGNWSAKPCSAASASTRKAPRTMRPLFRASRRASRSSMRSASAELVQRAPQFLVLVRRLLDYSEHGWRLPHPVARPGCVLSNSHEGYAAFRHSADPQHSVISLPTREAA
jgi:hypothetical protein